MKTTSVERDRVKTKNISLRIPEEYRKQLQIQSESKGISFNSHLLRILEIHLMGSGFGPTSVTSASGRLFEMRSELYVNNVDETSWVFFVNEPKYEKERAYYVIGLGRTVLRDWQVTDKEIVAREVGLALLSFYNRLGLDADKLAWNQYSGTDEDNKRLIQVAEVPETLEEFLDSLMSGRWKDQFLQASEVSQDIRRGRAESALYR
ncbi:MAG: hypothetical protein AB7W16_21345 [Candidatus Obscuribacterales bacterium]